MTGLKRLRLGALLAVTVAPCVPAAAQPQAQPPAPAPGTIGPRELQDFDLNGRRQPAQPRPTPLPPAPTPAQPQPTPPAATQTPPQQQPTQRAPVTQPSPPVTRAPGAPTAAPVPAPDAGIPVPPPIAADTSPIATDAPTNTGAAPTPEIKEAAPAAPLGQDEGLPLWVFLLGGLGVGLIGYIAVSRRRAAARRAAALPEVEPVAVAAAPSAPRAPRPDPTPRPWLEIEFTPERTTADPEESIVEFEMLVRNTGGSMARNVRLQAKLISSTPDQDKEIAAFHRKKPGEHRTLEIPDVPAGNELRLKGRVDVKREDLKALRMDQRLIWVPLVAVNAFYEWGSARSGQTSKSFLVGREQPEAKDRMAPFRLDLGPRVYRTVGQRPYKIERRV